MNRLPNKLERFFLDEPDTMLVDELCEKCARCHVLEQLYPEDNNETALNEISSSQLDIIMSSPNNLSTEHEDLKMQVEAVSNQLDNTTTINASNIPTPGRGTSRGFF